MKISKIIQTLLFVSTICLLPIASGCDCNDLDTMKSGIADKAAEALGTVRESVGGALSEAQVAMDKEMARQEEALRQVAAAQGSNETSNRRTIGGQPPAITGMEATDLAQLLNRPAFRSSWNTLFRQRMPDWVAEFTQTGNGVVTPATSLTINGSRYIKAWVCQPHNCGGNEVRVLFSTDGSTAWGLMLVQDGYIWLNNPPPPLRNELENP